MGTTSVYDTAPPTEPTDEAPKAPAATRAATPRTKPRAAATAEAPARKKVQDPDLMTDEQLQARAARMAEVDAEVPHQNWDANNPPPPGAKVWYRLPMSGTYGEWVPAMVINRMDGHDLDDPLDSEMGAVHLRIELSKSRHHAASQRGYRVNVLPGFEERRWCAEPPRDNLARVEGAKQREAAQTAARLEFMRERMDNL